MLESGFYFPDSNVRDCYSLKRSVETSIYEKQKTERETTTGGFGGFLDIHEKSSSLLSYFSDCEKGLLGFLSLRRPVCLRVVCVIVNQQILDLVTSIAIIRPMRMSKLDN